MAEKKLLRFACAWAGDLYDHRLFPPLIVEASSWKEAVKAVLEELRPNLQADGGDIEFVGIEEGVVKVKLKGACAGCPGAQMTLQFGVQKYLQERIPEVAGVEAV